MATIFVLHNYSGRRTAERPIYAGLYDVTDPALYGLAEYLLVNGHARVIDEPELDAESVVEPVESVPVAVEKTPVPPKASSARKRK